MIEKLYTLNPKALWAQMRREHFAFWMVCLYVMLQYFDPLEIYHRLAFLPWDKIVIVLALIAWPMDPHRRWVRDSTNIWMTLFLAVIIVASALAIYPSISWNHWFAFVGWYVLYFVIINIVTTKERFFIVLVIFLLANFKLSFFGARTWVSRGFGFTKWGIMGPPGDFQNSADFSTEMLMFAPIAFELALFVKPYVRRVTYWFLMLGAVTGVMSVLGASSRGSQVALAFQGAWVAIQRKLRLKVLIVLVVLGVAGYALLPGAEKARLMASGTDQTSIQRLDYWRAGLRMIENHPVLGVGFFNFPPVYAVQDPHKLFNGKAQLPHNIFIQVGTDAGLVGLSIFLILIYRNLKISKDIRRLCAENEHAPAFAPSIARGLALTTWGFIIAGQFNTVGYYSFLWINLALTVSLGNIVRQSAERSAAARLAQQPRESFAGIMETPAATQGKLAAPRNTS